MKLAAVALLVLAVSTSGCAIVHPHGSSAGLSAKKCPAGHVWSDGACHSKGKGHDK